MKSIIALTLFIGSLFLRADDPTEWLTNTVAHVPVQATNGVNLITCPVETEEGNLATNLFLKAVTGMVISKWNPEATNFLTVTNVSDGVWAGDTGMSLPPGVGFYITIPSNVTDATLIMRGAVRQGTNMLSFSAILQTLSGFMVPYGGRITSDLGFPATHGDQISILNMQGSLSTKTFIGGSWLGGEPYIQTGQGFWVKTFTNKTWTIINDSNLITPQTAPDPINGGRDPDNEERQE